MVRGTVNNCTCKATKPCYHMAAVQAREDARRQAEAEQQVERLTRDQYTAEFGIYA